MPGESSTLNTTAVVATCTSGLLEKPRRIRLCNTTPRHAHAAVKSGVKLFPESLAAHPDLRLPDAAGQVVPATISVALTKITATRERRHGTARGEARRDEARRSCQPKREGEGIDATRHDTTAQNENEKTDRGVRPHQGVRKELGNRRIMARQAYKKSCRRLSVASESQRTTACDEYKQEMDALFVLQHVTTRVAARVSPASCSLSPQAAALFS